MVFQQLVHSVQSVNADVGKPRKTTNGQSTRVLSKKRAEILSLPRRRIRLRSDFRPSQAVEESSRWCLEGRPDGPGDGGMRSRSCDRRAIGAAVAKNLVPFGRTDISNASPSAGSFMAAKVKAQPARSAPGRYPSLLATRWASYARVSNLSANNSASFVASRAFARWHHRQTTRPGRRDS